MGNYSVAAFLLRNNTSINYADRAGMTALHYASALGFDNIVRLLVEYGADPQRLSVEGNIPLDFSSKRGQQGSSKLLRMRHFEITFTQKTG